MFGTLFNDIYITREDDSGNVIDVIRVPITYAPKEKMLSRLKEDPNLDRKTAITTLPLLAFEMTSIEYDGERKLLTTGRVVGKTNSGSSVSYQYNPVPYNIHFRLYAVTKNLEDGNKIAEQILPFFVPDFTVAIDLIPELGITPNIPIILTDVSWDDSYSGIFPERQAIIWTFDFKVKGNFYGPVKSGATIRFTNTVFYTSSADNLRSIVGSVPPIHYSQSQPGLTVDGQPTDDITQTIDARSILATDNFGYILTETDVK